MVAIAPGLAVNSPNTAQRAPASSMRRILAALLRQTAPGVPVAGVLNAQEGSYVPLEVLTSSSEMKYVVRAGYAVTTRTGQGAYILGTPDQLDIPTATGHSTLSRIDRVYIVQPDYELSETGDPRIDVVQGTPASTPSLPALPTGALELGRKLVPAGAGNTALGTAITNPPARTSINIGSVSASQITDPENINAGKISGKKITVNFNGSAPSSPSVGDIWVDGS
jgi:hypothetical protein